VGGEEDVVMPSAPQPRHRAPGANLRAKPPGLLVRVPGQLGASDAAGEPQVVTDHGARSCLPADCAALHDDGFEALGRTVYRRSQAGRTGSDDRDVELAGAVARRDSTATSAFGPDPDLVGSGILQSGPIVEKSGNRPVERLVALLEWRPEVVIDASACDGASDRRRRVLATPVIGRDENDPLRARMTR